ncbi:nucleoside phosphorylase domain-containing protein [Rostrohypoxylon terebratum]|nr:nucleoside phosphorylase domain-containing protein [Rostrohypoxylon terebratum]
MGHQLSVEDFEIAIICALKVESDAVVAAFDELLEGSDAVPPLAKDRLDANAYTIGVMGDHHVVLAHMPNYGISSSAIVATDLRRTFPNIKVAFVVGVCGGVPKIKEDDIMLGDVIISTRVIQYGLGREFTHEFRPIDTTGREPCPELRSYLNKMQGEQELSHLEERTLEYLNAPRKSDWQPKCKHPGMENDKLFAPTHRHKHHQKGLCETCDKCLDDENPPCKESETLDCTILGCHEVVMRQRKPPSTQLDEAGAVGSIPRSLRPHVYFGAFGSADKVMKSSTERDRLVKELGIVALEMEGGGAWGTVPCVIIKGVCDYSDSHKNKVWQPYAAATAACCCKAFLVPWWKSVTKNRVQATGNTDPQTREFIQNLFALDPPSARSQIELDNGDLLPGTGSWLFAPPLCTSEETEANPQDLQSPYLMFNKWWTDDQA